MADDGSITEDLMASTELVWETQFRLALPTSLHADAGGMDATYLTAVVAKAAQNRKHDVALWHRSAAF